MRFKHGVQFQNLHKDLHDVFPIIEDCFNDFDSQLTITSGSEGKHMKGSRHYDGMAIDCRTRHLNTKTKGWIVQHLQQMLPKFDIVRERTHIHIEIH